MPPEPAPLGDLAAEDGVVRSHRFTAVNTALPFLRGDRETLERIEAFLRDEKLSVDIFALRRTGSEEPPMMGLGDGRGAGLRAGERVTLDVVVRNRGVGHTFPGGTNDSNEGWLELTVLDDNTGQILARSGAIGDDGHLDPMAHVYKAVFLDRNGRAIQRRNAQDIHVDAAINVIGPGSADVAHFEWTVPPTMGSGRVRVRARLLWRKFDRAYTEFAFAANPEGFRRFESTPDLPITEIALDELVLDVAPVSSPTRSGSATSAAADATGARETEDWTRYNDYGIGLLRENNTRAAVAPFERVAALQPESIEGPLNLARTALAGGNIDAAYEHLRRVEEILPADPRAAWVWGTVRQEDGRYEEAALAYRAVLETFPDDRAAWRNLGRTLYLDQRFEEALEALDRVLAIDPEDRVAHYHRLLSLRALGRTDEAELAEAAYERYRIDEAARAIAGQFRLSHPGVNLMAQDIHTHRLSEAESDARGGGDRAGG